MVGLPSARTARARSSCRPGRSRLRAIAEVVGRPRFARALLAVAQRQHDDVRLARDRDRVVDRAVGPPRASRSRPCPPTSRPARDHDARRPHHLDAAADGLLDAAQDADAALGDAAVAAQPARLGVGADRRRSSSPCAWSSGNRPPAFLSSTIDRSRRLARQRGVLGAARDLVRLLDVDVRLLEQPELELRPQHARHRLVDAAPSGSPSTSPAPPAADTAWGRAARGRRPTPAPAARRPRRCRTTECSDLSCSIAK